MSNAPVPAAAEGLPAALETRSQAEVLDSLLTSLLREIHRSNELEEAFQAAERTLPEWVRPGPKYLLSEGRFSAEISYWPRMEELPEPPQGCVMKLIRPSPRDVWEHATIMVRGVPHWEKDPERLERLRTTRMATRLQAFNRVRTVLDRLRRARAEKKAAGLPQIEAEQDACSNRISGLERRILEIAQGVSATDLALWTIIEECHERNRRDVIFDARYQLDFNVALLARLVPHLDGLLKILVEDYLVPGRTIDETLIGSGVPAEVDPLDFIAQARIERRAAA